MGLGLGLESVRMGLGLGLESVRVPMSAEGTHAVLSPTDLDHASAHDLEPGGATVHGTCGWYTYGVRTAVSPLSLHYVQHAGGP